MAAASSPPGGGISFDDALSKYVGEFGRSQIRILLFASLFWVGNGLLILLMVFHASPSPLKEHWWLCTDPADARCAEVFALEDPTNKVCELPSGSWTWTQPSKSIISQFNLICGSAWMSQFANSGFFMGYLVGSGVFGGVADTRGRKVVLFGCTALGAVATVAAGLSPNYVAYFIFRLITGIGAAGQALTAYILSTESVGPTWRGTAGVATQLFFILGEFVLVLVAYIARPWRTLCFACAAINAALLVLWPTFPESPRWLLVRGRRQEATAILARIAAGNGRAMPSEPLGDGADAAPAADASATAAAAAAEEGMPLTGSLHQQLSDAGDDAGAAAGGAAAKPRGGPQQPVTLTGMLLRDRHMLRRFLVLAYVWLAICMAYYGISLGLGGLPGSIYMTFMITAAAELPANILAAWMIERYGRHNTMAAGMLLGGAACLGCAFVPAGIATALMAAVGKFGCAGAFTVASIFTSEMFPTLVRSAVLGAENEAARVGGISAPFIVLIGISTGQGSMPFIIFGVTSLVAGVAILTLPETLGTRLPDTMSDMGGIQSIFTTQPWRRGGWRQTLSEIFRARGGPASRPSPAASPIKAAGPSGRHAAAHPPGSPGALISGNVRAGAAANGGAATHGSLGAGGAGAGASSQELRRSGDAHELENVDLEVQIGAAAAVAAAEPATVAGKGEGSQAHHHHHHHRHHHHRQQQQQEEGNGGYGAVDGADGANQDSDEHKESDALLRRVAGRSDALGRHSRSLGVESREGPPAGALQGGVTVGAASGGATGQQDAGGQDSRLQYYGHKREEIHHNREGPRL